MSICELQINLIVGDCNATVKKAVTESVEWARLEDSDTIKVSTFINNVILGGKECSEYLFDWSIPIHCHRLAEELIIPKYFAGQFNPWTDQACITY